MDRNTRQIDERLPYVLRDKLRYYLDYVHDRLTDIALEDGMSDLVTEVRAEVELIFTLRLLYGYFVVGFENYDRMMTFFERMDINGFQIGSSVFNRQSPLAKDWSALANQFREMLSDSRVEQAVQQGQGVDQIIRGVLFDHRARNGSSQK